MVKLVSNWGGGGGGAPPAHAPLPPPLPPLVAALYVLTPRIVRLGIIIISILIIVLMNISSLAAIYSDY